MSNAYTDWACVIANVIAGTEPMNENGKWIMKPAQAALVRCNHTLVLALTLTASTSSVGGLLALRVMVWVVCFC